MSDDQENMSDDQEKWLSYRVEWGGDEGASREYRRAEIARDALGAFTDEQLREMGGDPDDLRRRVREAGLAGE